MEGRHDPGLVQGRCSAAGSLPAEKHTGPVVAGCNVGQYYHMALITIACLATLVGLYGRCPRLQPPACSCATLPEASCLAAPPSSQAITPTPGL